MNYAIYMPPSDDFSDPRVLAELARDSEQAGWDGFFIRDHMLLPGSDRTLDPWVERGRTQTPTRRAPTSKLEPPGGWKASTPGASAGIKTAHGRSKPCASECGRDRPRSAVHNQDMRPPRVFTYPPLPETRQKPVVNTPGVFFVAWQLVLECLILQSRTHDQDATRQGSRDQRPRRAK